MLTVKTWEELGITDNFMFKKVMGKPEICRAFLSRVLGVRIDAVSYPQAEKEIENGVAAKSVRLDVYAEAGNRVFDIEMQATDRKKDPLGLRARYYQSAIDQELLGKGEDYAKLRESYIIFICTFDPCGLGLSRYTFRSRCDERPGLTLADKAVKVFLYTEGDAAGLDAELAGFLRYAAGNPAKGCLAADVAAEVENVRANGKAKEEFMTLAMEIKHHVEMEKDNWLAEGRAEGRAEGKAEGKAEVALKLVQLGLPIAQIAEATGLPAEQIKSLRNEQ